jgi:hypothetical protein
MHLKARNTGQRAAGGANFGGIVGKGVHVVAQEGGGARELVACNLHAVARVAGKANRGGVDLFDFLVLGRNRFSRDGHGGLQTSFPERSQW